MVWQWSSWPVLTNGKRLKSVSKSLYGVTIQMKHSLPLISHVTVCILSLNKMKFSNFLKILSLETFDSDRVKHYYVFFIFTGKRCLDGVTHCHHWAKEGYCNARGDNSRYSLRNNMRRHCRYSCKMCDWRSLCSRAFSQYSRKRS